MLCISFDYNFPEIEVETPLTTANEQKPSLLTRTRNAIRKCEYFFELNAKRKV